MRALLAVMLVTVAACASVTAPPIADVKDLAGVWRGRVSGARGNATAVMTVKEDGAYTGTMYLDGDDREFRGTVTVVSGRARYLDSNGTGSVRLEEHGGRRVLRFVTDGGGGGAIFEPQR
jgi:hypothetical protein